MECVGRLACENVREYRVLVAQMARDRDAARAEAERLRGELERLRDDAHSLMDPANADTFGDFAALHFIAAAALAKPEKEGEA